MKMKTCEENQKTFEAISGDGRKNIKFTYIDSVLQRDLNVEFDMKEGVNAILTLKVTYHSGDSESGYAAIGWFNVLRSKCDELEAELRVKLETKMKLLKNCIRLRHDICSICRDEAKCDIITPCGHEFHADCLAEWLNTQNSCPICKSNLI